MLARLWPHNMPAPVWQGRQAQTDIDIIWDITQHAAPPITQPISAVIVLAGVTRGTDAQLAQNTALAQAGSTLAQRLGCKALIASSQAVYGRQTGVLSETVAPTLADAAGVAWDWQPAPDAALPELAMDVTALSRIVAQTDTSAADLVAQARAGGWVAA